MFGWNKKYKWGVALGGGGARGFAHLGVLKALYEKGIKPDVISGVSAGAIVGGFIVSGKTPDETFEIIRKYKFNDLTKLRIPRGGLLTLDKLKSTIELELSSERVEDLDIPLIISVSNILTGKIEYKKTGDLASLIQASASIPVLFRPVEIDGQLYADGGLLDNLPYDPLLSLCKKVVGVSISPVQELTELDGLVSIAARTFQLSVNTKTKEAKKACDIFIEPPELSKFDLLDTSNAEAIFNVGYEYAKSFKI